MSTPEPKVVTLRTGAQVPEPIVATTMLALEALMDTNPIALYEAAMVARDRTHVPFGKTGDVLRDLSLMRGAALDVILASTDGDGFDIRLVSPYAAEDVAQ